MNHFVTRSCRSSGEVPSAISENNPVGSPDTSVHEAHEYHAVETPA